MRRSITGFHVVVALGVVVLLALTISRVGYSQGQGLPVWSQCQAFQQTLATDIFSGTNGASGQIQFATGVAITIEQVALRIDAIDRFVTPTVAAVTTSLHSHTSTFYLPIRPDFPSVTPVRPLTLMQPGPLYADGGTIMNLSVAIDPRYGNGNGRIEWSISGRSCSLS